MSVPKRNAAAETTQTTQANPKSDKTFLRLTSQEYEHGGYAGWD
jgi:hypothetical protein